MSEEFPIIIGYDQDNSSCAVQSQLRRTARCPFPGRFAEITETLFRAAHLKYKLIVFPDFKLDYIKGVYNWLDNHTIDAVLSFDWYGTTERLDRGYQFSYDLDPTRTIYAAIPYSSEPHRDTSNSQAYTGVFTPIVWGILIGLFLFLKIYKRVFYSLLPQKKSFVLSFLRVTLLRVMLSLYTNLLAARLLVPEPMTTITDFDGLISAMESKQIRLTIDDSNGWYVEAIARSNMSAYIRLQKALKMNPPLVSSAEIEDLLLEPKLFMIVDHGNALQMARNCTIPLRILPLPEFGAKLSGYMFSPLTPKKLINQLNEAIFTHDNLIVGIRERYLNQILMDSHSKCNHSREDTLQTSRKQKTVIKLSSVDFLFAGLTVIYVFLLAFLVAEICNKRLGLIKCIHRVYNDVFCAFCCKRAQKFQLVGQD